jgi:acyl-CoA synthetase (AMP-forming)/AMP-acid ligase II
MEFNLADLYEVVADVVPDRLALVAGEQRLSFAELDARANRVGHHLVERGLAPGDKVGVYAWNRAEWIESMLGCFKARLVPVNVNYRYVADELRYLFDDADLAALIYERSFAPLVDEVRPALPLLAHELVLEDGADAAAPVAVPYEEALAAAAPARGVAPRSADDLYMLYTGGTTGMPKGVMWRQEDIFFAAMGGGNFAGPPIEAPEGLAELISPEPGITVVTPPMMHGGGQWVSFINFYGGNTVILYIGRHYDPHEIWRTVEREGATSVMVVGDAMARPLGEALAEPGASYDTSTVFTVGSGGAILSKAVKEQLRAELPHALVIDSFGASETGAAGRVDDLNGPAAGPRFSVGDDTSVLGDDLRAVRPGSGCIGRLAKRGHIPLGYYKDPQRTAATFPTDPDGVRWVTPGDFATVEADGTIMLLGRGSVSINSGGEKIFPEEVEAALKSHPGVFDAVVVGVPDPRFGERVAALVQSRPGAVVSLEDLAGHCRTKVAGYKLPRELHLLDAIERTPAGKPDYRWPRSAVLNLTETRSGDG